MPAGSAPTGDYWKALTSLLRQDLFTDPEGTVLAACLELKAHIEQELQADFLLIDSRTGVTELSGVTTAVLADKVVCLMLANRESQFGARAVLRSLRHAARPAGLPSVGVIPVLSRVPERDESVARQALLFLNEPGPTLEETLALEKVFVLRTDPDLARGEKLHIGSGETKSQSPLYQDYLTLLAELFDADPAKAAAAVRRQEAIRETREWLTGASGMKPVDVQDLFGEDQLTEGVEIQGEGGETRYADLVGYSPEDRTEALIAVEYVEDLSSTDARKWWLDKTKLGRIVLIEKKPGEAMQRRVITRGLPPIPRPEM